MVVSCKSQCSWIRHMPVHAAYGLPSGGPPEATRASGQGCSGPSLAGITGEKPGYQRQEQACRGFLA
jgi:hypothetical protein